MAQIAMLAVAVLTVYPLYFIIVTAFKTRAEYLDNRFLPPSDPTLENFRRAFRDGELLTWIGNSVMITIASVVVSTAIAALAAYPLARASFPGRRVFFSLTVALMVVPPVVLVVPLFLFFVDLGLINSRLSVIIIYAGLLVPFSIFLLVNFFATIPRSLEDAARIDGARRLRTLWSLILPLSAPAMVTIVVVNAVWVWNELLIALLQDTRPNAHRRPHVLPGPVSLRPAARHDRRVDRRSADARALPRRPALLHPRPDRRFR